MQNSIRLFLLGILLINSTIFQIFLEAGKGEPPELYENVRTRFRIPLGTKPFKLSCPIKIANNISPNENDGTIVKWTKDGEELDTDWSGVQFRLLNYNRELKIRNPQIVDSGLYKCMAINGFGHKEMEFSLEIYDSKISDYENPSTSIVLSDLPSSPIWHNRTAMDLAIKTPIRIKFGSKLVLMCPAKGNPLPKIEWLKNGQPTNIELINPTSAKYTENVTLSGIYTCRLENSHGSLEADFIVQVVNNDENSGIFSAPFGSVDVVGNLDGKLLINNGGGDNNGGGGNKNSPIVAAQPPNSSVRAGHTANFQCKVQWGKDVPMIRWLRKIQNPQTIKLQQPNATILHINEMHLLVLEQGNDAVSVVQNNNNDNNNNPHSQSPTTHSLGIMDKFYINQLIIPNVQRHDSGRYFCVVTNSAGQFVYHSAYLDVINNGAIFSLFFTASNVFIGIIAVLMLTFAIISVCWLCCNANNNTSNNLNPPSNATLTSGTSSTNSSSSSSTTTTNSEPNCQSAALSCRLSAKNAIKRAFLPLSQQNEQQGTPPPPPRIPLPKAPQQKQQQHNYNLEKLLPNEPALKHNHTKSQQQLIYNNDLINSPLIWMPSSSKCDSKTGPIRNATDILDRRYRVQQQQQQQQQFQRTTRADDEMSRLSSNIYASGTPLSTSPIPGYNNNNNNNEQQPFTQSNFSSVQQYWPTTANNKNDLKNYKQNITLFNANNLNNQQIHQQMPISTLNNDLYVMYQPPYHQLEKQ